MIDTNHYGPWAVIAGGSEGVGSAFADSLAQANSYGHEFVTGELDKVQGVIDLNITRQLELAQHFGAKMKERGRGGIMLLGSLAGYMGSEQQSIYGAAKAFSRVFAEGLWLELKPFGVHVVELVLGVTRTPAMERAGLRFDIPGLNVAEAEDVAREGLEHLADGPVWITGGNYKAAQQRSGFPRDVMVQAAADGMRKLLGRQ